MGVTGGPRKESFPNRRKHGTTPLVEMFAISRARELHLGKAMPLFCHVLPEPHPEARTGCARSLRMEKPYLHPSAMALRQASSTARRISLGTAERIE
jgi:hypothetical protein